MSRFGFSGGSLRYGSPASSVPKDIGASKRGRQDLVLHLNDIQAKQVYVFIGNLHEKFAEQCSRWVPALKVLIAFGPGCCCLILLEYNTIAATNTSDTEFV